VLDPPRQLLALDRDMIHDVEVEEDSALALPIAWPQARGKG
jgi:hypothetical protein